MTRVRASVYVLRVASQLRRSQGPVLRSFRAARLFVFLRRPQRKADMSSETDSGRIASGVARRKVLVPPHSAAHSTEAFPSV